MVVLYDRLRGIRRTNFDCGAEVGYHVVAYGRSYEVVEIGDFGCYVCRNLNPDCLANDKYKTFDDLDISESHPPIIGHGEYI